jgi:hypothetical protein
MKMTQNSKTTQRQRILDYLDEFGSITRLQGLADLGIMNLPTRIHELRKMGYNIVSETVKVKNRWGEDCRIVKYKYGEEIV